MDREVMKLRNMLSLKFSENAYYGYWFSPEMDFLINAIDNSQVNIEGIVHLTLYKGNIIMNGRDSVKSLYNQELSSMDEAGGFNQKDSEGFIKINAVRLKAYNYITGKNKKS
jgi:argininosuccinate synthase